MFSFADLALAGDIQLKGAWARASIGTERPGVAYLTIHNMAAASDRLLGAETSVAKHATVHESLMKDGVMKMRPVGEIEIQPGGMVMLEPGGLHLMLTFLQKKLVEDESFALTLTFEHAGEVMVDVMIAGMGAKKAPHEHHEHHGEQKHHDQQMHKEHHGEQEHQEHHDNHHE